MVGKLGWHAQALQAVRTHIRARGGSRSHSAITSGTLSAPSSSVTHSGGSASSTRGQSPSGPHQRFLLLFGAVFQADPSRLQILVSDATGDDGVGCFFDALGPDAPDFQLPLPIVRAACTASTAASARRWTASLSWSPPWRAYCTARVLGSP